MDASTQAGPRFPHPPTVPSGLRASELSIGGERWVILSHPLEHGACAPLDRLTTAERAVVELAVEGLSNAQIAERRGSAVRTVANQMASTFRKLEVSSRYELAALYLLGEL